MGSKIFVSYRRDDSAGRAEQIAGALSDHFGDERVFIDVDDIGGGSSWADVLRDSLDDPGVVVAVIGRDWVTAKDAAGNLRLQDPNDWVRREVATAIDAATVLPVLVDGAPLPAADDLPPDLRRLSSHQAIMIPRGTRFEDHVPVLVRSVERALARSEQVRSEGVHTNIVRELTAFIGRHDEVEELESELTHARLVTITGPGGVGKSRLARETALRLVHQYQDGAWLVSLSDLDDPALLESEVANVLGVPEPSDRPVGTALAEYLAGRDVLLILDGCDRVIDRAAELAHALVSHTRRLDIVATCREPLGIPGEAVWALEPLEVPQPGVGGDAIRGSEAAQLFAARARLVDRNFRIDDDHVDEIGDVCRMLDGLPLAIELAAANMAATTVAELANRLRAGLQMLTTRSRLVAPRQQTLQDTIRWSYDLLAPEERTVLDRLGIFRSGFTVEAAEEVTGWGDVNGSDVARTVFRLVEKSLVSVAPQPSPEVRYRLYRTVRQFAQEQLAATDAAAETARRHAAYYLGWAERGAVEVIGEAHRAWMQRFDAEDDNLRAALDWALDTGEVELATRLGAALVWFWYWSSRFAEARESLRRVNDIVESPDSTARSAALFGEGLFASMSGDLDGAAVRFEESADVGERLGDTAAVGRGLMGLGTVALYRGDLGEAARHLDASEQELRKLGRPVQLPLTLRFVGTVAGLRGKVERAQEALEEALAMLRNNPGSGGVSWSLDELGDLAARQREFERAEEYLAESLAVSERIGSVRQRPWTLLRQAQVARGQEDEEDEAAEEAATLLTKAIELFRVTGEDRGLGWAMCERAEQALQKHDRPAAEAALAEAAGRFEAVGDQRGAAEVERLRGDLALQTNDLTTAARLHRGALEAFVAAEDTWGASHALTGLGQVELRRENLVVAASLMGAAQGLQESLKVASPDAIAGSPDLMTAGRRLGLDAKTLRRAWEAGVAATDEPKDVPITREKLAELLGENDA